MPNMQGKTIKLWKIENDRENHIGDMNALILEISNGIYGEEAG